MTTARHYGITLAWASLLAMAIACGGGGSPTTPSTGGTGTGGGTGGGGTGGGGTSTDPVFTISAAGVVTPSEITIGAGQRVTFVNNDSRAHDMSSDPHPDHTDCPEINQVGFLQTGQRKETGNMNTVRTCGFHDHNQPSNNSLRGRIVIR